MVKLEETKAGAERAGGNGMLPFHLSEGVGRRPLGSLDMTCVDTESGLDKFRGQMLELYLPAWLQNKEGELLWSQLCFR